MTNPTNLLDRLEALLDAWRIDRDKRLLVDPERRTIYWRLYVDGEPTTAPQTCAELYKLMDAETIAACVNAAPALLRLARAAQAWRKQIGGIPAMHCERDLLVALDALNGGKP